MIAPILAQASKSRGHEEEWFRRVMIDKEITQSALAREVGLSRTRINDVLSNVRRKLPPMLRYRYPFPSETYVDEDVEAMPLVGRIDREIAQLKNYQSRATDTGHYPFGNADFYERWIVMLTAEKAKLGSNERPGDGA
jgi:transcriptional regulator with XRE-family HTH domain